MELSRQETPPAQGRDGARPGFAAIPAWSGAGGPPPPDWRAKTETPDMASDHTRRFRLLFRAAGRMNVRRLPGYDCVTVTQTGSYGLTGCSSSSSAAAVTPTVIAP